MAAVRRGTVQHGRYRYEVVLLPDGAALVSSVTHPDEMHSVTGDRCDCVGYSHRGRCNHLDAVWALRERFRNEEREQQQQAG